MRSWHHLFHSLLSFIALLVLIVALVISVARSLTPLLNTHKGWFEQLATHFIGSPVEIESVNASFEDFAPEFDFEDVTILSVNTQQPFLKLASLHIGINLLQTIWQRQFVAKYFILEGTTINLQRSASGSYSINQQVVNTNTNSSLISQDWLSPDTQSMANLLLAQQQITLKDINLSWQTKQHLTIIIPNLTVTLLNNGNNHQLRGSADLITKTHSKLIVAMDLTGNVMDRNSLHGLFYWQVKAIPLGTWFREMIPQIHIKKGEANIKMWIDLQKGKVQDAQALVDFNNLSLQSAKNNAIIPITALTGDLLLQQPEPDHWRFAAEDLTWVFQQRAWSLDNLSLDYDANKPSQALYLKSFNLAKLQTWLAINTWLPEHYVELAKQYQARGQLQDLAILHQGDLSNTDLNSFYLHTLFKNVSIASVNGLPGISHFTAELTARPEGGNLLVNSNNGQVDLSNLFTHALPFTMLSGNITWQKLNAGWQIDASNLHFANPIFDDTTQMSLLYQNSISASHIDLLSTFTQTDSSKINNLLPTRIMSLGLTTWLEQAFIAGENETGTIVMRGKLGDFPYLAHNGQFIADVTINNMTLSYADGWPYVYQLNGRLRFDPLGMHFKAASGMTVNQVIDNTTAEIPGVISGKAASLYIHTNVAMDISDALHFIEVSPLQKTLSGLSELKGKGQTKLALDLTIPLSSDSAENTKVKGKLNLVNDSIVLPNWGLNLDNANGLLLFTEKGVWSNGLHTSLFNQPTLIKIKTLADGKHQTITQFIVASKVDINDIKKHFSLPDFSMLHGISAYTGVLNLRSKNQADQLIIKSNLSGINIDLPPPYGKTAQQVSPFSLLAFFNKQSTQLKINYQDKLTANILLSHKNPDSTIIYSKINFGPKILSLPKQPGLIITGYIPEFDWSVWQPYLSKHTSNNSTGASTNTKQAKLYPNVDLGIGKITAYGQTIFDANIQIQHTLDNWQTLIDSTNIAGTILLPDNFPQQALGLYFKRLYLEPIKTSADNDNTPASHFDPSSIPPLTVNIDDFRYGEHHFNMVKFNLLSNANGMTVNNLEIKSSTIDLAGSGSWIKHKQDTLVSVNGAANFTNLGDTLTAWGINDKLYQGNGQASFKLSLPLAKAEIDFKHAQGHAKLELKNGIITGLDDNTNKLLNVGKALNLFSLDTLWRRLTLNFSDLTHKGYSFDTITGNYVLAHGKAGSTDTYVKGPVADLYLTGNVNLLAKNYDLKLKVVPHYTSSVPVIATILGGPIIGVAAFAADALISPGVEKASGQNYTLTGPWDAPVIEKVK